MGRSAQPIPVPRAVLWWARSCQEALAVPTLHEAWLGQIFVGCACRTSLIATSICTGEWSFMQKKRHILIAETLFILHTPKINKLKKKLL